MLQILCATHLEHNLSFGGNARHAENETTKKDRQSDRAGEGKTFPAEF